MSDILTPIQYLEGLESSLGSTPEVQSLIVDAKNAYNKRWWHELGTLLLKALNDSKEVRAVSSDLHLNVLCPVRNDISPEIYVKIVFITVSNMTDAPAASQLLEGALTALLGNGGPRDQNYRSLQCVKALLLMRTDVTLEARRLIDGVEEFCNSIQTHELSHVLRAFLFKALCRQHELLSEFTKFYESVFDLVSCHEKADISIGSDELSGLAYKTALAGLLSPTIHNFGKLITTKAFTDSLDASNDAWLLDWVRICNAGDVAASETFVENHGDGINAIPDLVAALPSLNKKVRLMALLHLVFHTPSDQRTFNFDQIAQRCATTTSEVPTLLLTALALHLIEGTIDGLDNTIRISWVQPRVLSLDEVRELAKRIGEWKKQVKETTGFVGELAKEIPQ